MQKLVVDKGKLPDVNIVTSQTVSLLTKKGENPSNFTKELSIQPSIQAPLMKNQVVGHIFIKKDGKEVTRIDLYPEKSIEQAGTWEILKRTSKKIVFLLQ